MVRPLMQAKQHLHGPPDGVEPRRFLGAAKARVDHGLSDPGHHMRDPGFTPSYHMIEQTLAMDPTATVEELTQPPNLKLFVAKSNQERLLPSAPREASPPCPHSTPAITPARPSRGRYACSARSCSARSCSSQYMCLPGSRQARPIDQLGHGPAPLAEASTAALSDLTADSAHDTTSAERPGSARGRRMHVPADHDVLGQAFETTALRAANVGPPSDSGGKSGAGGDSAPREEVGAREVMAGRAAGTTQARREAGMMAQRGAGVYCHRDNLSGSAVTPR